MSLITAYNPLPIAFTRGEGVWLYDADGNAWLDSLGGIAVCGLGHSHPDITRTIAEQAGRLMHVSNGVIIPEQEALAARLTAMTGMDQVFFSNSGAEANEAAIKLTRLYGHQKGILNPTIIVMEGAFHGRTMATLTASGSRKVQAGFEPLVPGFVRAPYNDLAAIRTIAANRNDVVAIMLETIQGEGGIRLAEKAYLQEIRALCQKEGWLLILDEIQTGNGRTGKYFDTMHFDIMPDILTTAKGLGNGFPIGACLMRGAACNLFKPGNHGSTFGGNPLACATALTVLDVIARDKLCEKVAEDGPWLMNRLSETIGHHPMVKHIRGRGFMIGIELDRPASGIRPIALKNGLLLNVTSETVIRLLPALIMTRHEITVMVEKLQKSLEAFAEIP